LPTRCDPKWADAEFYLWGCKPKQPCEPPTKECFEHRGTVCESLKGGSWITVYGRILEQYNFIYCKEDVLCNPGTFAEFTLTHNPKSVPSFNSISDFDSYFNLASWYLRNEFDTEIEEEDIWAEVELGRQVYVNVYDVPNCADYYSLIEIKDSELVYENHLGYLVPIDIELFKTIISV
jgi:hypothetical protein